MDERDKPFLTMADREYLEAVFLALERVHHVPPDRAAAAVRRLAADIHRRRMGGQIAPPERLFSYGSVAAQSETLAALLIEPKTPKRVSLALLALLAAVAGVLGMRVLLALVFRRWEPVGIGGVEITLVVGVVGVVLALAKWGGAQRLARRGWFGGALALGAVAGVAIVRFLRPFHATRPLVVLPLWAAICIAVVCAALLWLLTWPEEHETEFG